MRQRSAENNISHALQAVSSKYKSANTWFSSKFKKFLLKTKLLNR